MTYLHVPLCSPEVTEGMHFLHSRAPPLVHRDLKSHNVLLSCDGNAKVILHWEWARVG